MSITGSCHCGDVSWELSVDPEWATECNCSYCRRIGALWAHADIETVTITASKRATFQYIQGAETLAMHICGTCGNVTHWKSLNPEEEGVMAVNLRLADPFVLQYLDVRHFDGAETFSYLD